MHYQAYLSALLKRVYPHRVSARDEAPADYSDLVNVSNMVVYAGASDQTIWGAPEDNHRFRAWHDSVHLSHGLTFSDEHERAVGTEQARLFGQWSSFAADMVHADVVKQVEYLRKHGAFPIDQRAYIETCVGVL